VGWYCASMPRWRIAVGAAAAVCGAAVVSGCSTTPSSTVSNTPALPTGKGTASEKAALLTTDDLQAIAGAPTDLAVDSSKQPVGLFQEPDTRGPCGAQISIPDLSTAALDQFGSAGISGFQTVVDLSVAKATAFTTAWAHDTRAGCHSYTTLTNTGSSETVKLLAVLRLPPLVDQATGCVAKITTQGHSSGVYILVFRSGGRVVIDGMITATPLSDAFGNGFATAAESKLNASLAGS
jgi:hypothetical protein